MSETIPAKLEAMDDRFHTCQGDSTVERLYAGCRWAEGPVYVPSGRYLVWSDIPNDRLLRWDETTGVVGVFRHPAGYANGGDTRHAGQADHVRAREPGRLADRARRLGHHDRRSLRREAAEQPERRGRSFGRVDLVHRPRKASSTAFGSTRRDACGPLPATAFTASIRTAR